MVQGIGIVRYYMQYQENGVYKLLSFGLGSSIVVNGLIGLATLRAWKMVLDKDTSKQSLFQMFTPKLEHGIY